MNTTTHLISTLSNSMEALRMSTAILGVIIYVAGFIGNFLSLLLFIQKELRQASTGLTFLLLNIFSSIHLLSLTVEYLDSIFHVQVLPSSIFRCQFILWLQNATRTICSLLAATVSIDRFLRSEYPMQSRLWCTCKNIMKIFIGYFLFSILFYAFFFDPLNTFDSNGHCSFTYNPTFRLFALNILPPIRFVMICVIPVFCMLACGGRMLHNIQQSKSRVVPQQQTPVVQNVATVLPSSQGSNVNDESRRKKLKIDNMLVIMVLANVVAYILTQIPFNIYTLYYGYETSNDYTFYSLIRAFLLMWSSVYFGMSLYLFCITSPQFRKQFIRKVQTLCSWHRAVRQQTTIRRTK